MNIYLIIFNIDNSLKESIINRIKNRWCWARIVSNVWCVKTNTSHSEIRNELCVESKDFDRIMVIDITDSSWATSNLPNEVTQWLKK